MPVPSPSPDLRRARLRGSAPLRALAVVLVLSLVAVFGATIASGQAPTPVSAVDQTLLTRVVPRDVPGTQAALAVRSSAPVVLEAIPDFLPAERSFAPRPAPELRQAVGVIVKATPTPRPTPRPQAPSTRSSGGGGGGGSGGGGGGSSVSGPASWYCLPGTSACHYQYSGGMYAAAGPALRVGSWRGRTVRVCGGGNCVSVKLIDWCGCPNGRVIDLYSDAFRRLAPLSSGVIRVTVSW